MFFVQKLYFSCFHSHFFHLIIKIRKTGRIFHADINAEPAVIKGDPVFQFLKISYNDINRYSPAAVVRPRILNFPDTMILPAPRKPIPLTT